MLETYSETSYTGSNFSDLYREEKNYWWSRARRNLINRFIRKLALLSDSTMVLDVGCGGGALLSSLQGCRKLFGLEPSIQGAIQSAAKTRARIVRGNAEDLPFKKGHFDILTSLDTIEHVDDDSKALRNFHHVLNDKGIVVLTVPAFKFLWSPRDVLLGHKRRYTAAGLKLLLKKVGFKIIKCSYINSFYFPGLFLYSLSKRIVRPYSKPKTDILLLPGWIAALFSFILKVEESILLHMNIPLGTAVLCIAKKERDMSQC